MKTKPKNQLSYKKDILIYSGFLLIPTKIPLLWGRSYSGDFSDPRFLIVMGLFVVGIILGLIFKKYNETHGVKHSINKGLAELKKTDPIFSKRVLLIFASAIYKKYYSDEDLKNLIPFFLSDKELLKAQAKIKYLAIKRIRIQDIWKSYGGFNISVYIYAKYSYNQKKYKVKEKWDFYRNEGVLSHESQIMQQLLCPVCAGGSLFTEEGVCENCETLIRYGERQWGVSQHKIM